SGASVLEAYGGLLAGMCGSWQALSETGVAATPYILTGLAVALGFRGGGVKIWGGGGVFIGAPGAVGGGYGGWGGPPWGGLALGLGVGGPGGGPWGALSLGPQ